MIPFSDIMPIISIPIKIALIALQHTDFSVSDAVMSKCISTAISLVWTEEQIHEKGAAFLAVLKKVVA